MMMPFVLAMAGLSWCQIVFDQSTLTDQESRSVKVPTSSDLATLNQWLSEAAKLPQIEGAAVVRTGHGFRLEVVRSRKIARINFKGLQNVSENDALGVLALREGDSYVGENLNESALRLGEYLQEQGYLSAEVTAESKVRDDQVDINFEIQLGQATVVRQIVVQAASDLARRIVENETIKFKNKVYTRNIFPELSQAARVKLSQRGFYRAFLSEPKLNFSPDERELTITYLVNEPIHYEIFFEGLQTVSYSTLTDELRLSEYFSSSRYPGYELAANVKSLLVTRGYAKARVDAEEKTVSTTEAKLTLRVSEGPLVHIKRVILNGAIANNEAWYRKFISEHASVRVEDGLYIRDDLDRGLINLVTNMKNQGYLQFTVASSRTEYLENGRQVEVTVDINEGPITILRALYFPDAKAFAKEDLVGVFGMRPGQALRFNSFEEGLAKIKSYYLDHGFLDFKWTSEKENPIQYAEGDTRADVVLKFHEGPQVQASDIVIEGLTLTKPEIILRELEFQQGDVISPRIIEESVARLQRLGHFSNVEILPQGSGGTSGSRSILVRLVERNPGLFNVGFGVNNERTLTLRGFAGAGYRNILGTGRGVSLRLDGNYNIADVKYLESRTTIGYVEPYLLASRTRGKVTYVSSESVSDFANNQITEVSQTTFSLEQDVTSHLLVIFDLWNSAFVRDFYIRESSSLPEVRQRIVTIGPTVELDYRDHPFNPTKGTFSRLAVEYSDPRLGSTPTIKYIRGIASFTDYLPIEKLVGVTGLVWANSVRLGHLRNLKDAEPEGRPYGVPYDKKGFLLGGPSTIRGFDASESFPNYHELGSEKFLLTKSVNMALFKSELRFPIFGNFQGALFYDGGSVRIEELNGYDSFRDAVGLALRYATPVGAASAEVGFKLDRKPERQEDFYRFHLTVGTF